MALKLSLLSGEAIENIKLKKASIESHQNALEKWFINLFSNE